MNQLFSMKDISRKLSIQPHKINYAINSGFVPEPKLRLAGKRVFLEEDLERLKKHFENRKETEDA